MKRWVHDAGANEVEAPRADAFIADLIAVYRKHGLSLGHEDQHGGFIVEPLCDLNVEWLSSAAAEPAVLAPLRVRFTSDAPYPFRRGDVREVRAIEPYEGDARNAEPCQYVLTTGEIVYPCHVEVLP